jgi:hypothetical protein
VNRGLLRTLPGGPRWLQGDLRNEGVVDLTANTDATAPFSTFVNAGTFRMAGGSFSMFAGGQTFRQEGGVLDTRNGGLSIAGGRFEFLGGECRGPVSGINSTFHRAASGSFIGVALGYCGLDTDLHADQTLNVMDEPTYGHGILATTGDLVSEGWLVLQEYAYTTRVDVTGGFTQRESGGMLFQLYHDSSGWHWPQVMVSGTADLDGTIMMLAWECNNIIGPFPGDRFDLLYAPNLTSNGVRVVSAPWGAVSGGWRLIWEPDHLTAEYVPEPMTAALLAVGGLLALRRRRR